LRQRLSFTPAPQVVSLKTGRYDSRALTYIITVSVTESSKMSSLLRISLVVALTLAEPGLMRAAAQKRKMTQTKTTSAIEQMIISLEGDIFTAIKNRDTAALSRILADDFVYRTATGDEFDRAAFLQNIAAMPYRILDVQGEHLKVKVYGDTAVLTGVQKARVRDDKNNEVISTVAFTDVFVRRRRQWVMALAFGVELPTPG
jgi:ketosteroid isomerase-like protein